VLAAFASGYGFGVFIGQANVGPQCPHGLFKASIRRRIGFWVKCLLPALLTGVICSDENGLSVEGGVTEVAAGREARAGPFARALFATPP